MAYYLFNVVPGDTAYGPAPHVRAAEYLRAGMWNVEADDRNAEAFVVGDRVLVYVGAPRREFTAQAELASACHRWTPQESQACPGDSRSGVLLGQVQMWEPPVPMSTVLQHVDRSEGARADFEEAVVPITENEYQTVIGVAVERGAAASL